MLNFKVHGRAVPQGSKTAFVVNGRAVIKEQHGKRHKDWRKLVKEAAAEATERPLRGPVAVQLHFWMPRPKKHYRKRQGQDVLKDDAPTWVYNRSVGDIDKLTRAVLDSLDDAGVFEDDSQVADLSATKRYSDGEAHVHIMAWEVPYMEGEQ